MRPLVSYYGGKQRLAPRLIPLIPPHSVYVEPFAGGAALLFAKGRPAITNKGHYREVLNDKDNRITTLYRVARERPDELIRLLQMTPFSRDDYRRAYAIIDGYLMADELMVAWAVWIALQCSFANTIGGGFRFALSTNEAAIYAKKQIRLPEQCARLSGVSIESLDALEILKKYDSPQTFFYCDPPYPGSYQGHYNGYSTKEFNALVEALENCLGAYMLSCYDAEGIKAPRDAERIELNARMSAALDKSLDTRRIEVVYRRPARIAPRPGLKLFTGADMVSSNR